MQIFSAFSEFSENFGAKNEPKTPCSKGVLVIFLMIIFGLTMAHFWAKNDQVILGYFE